MISNDWPNVRRRLPRSSAAFAAALVALAIAGCGGGSSTSAAMTKQEFLKQGNAICEKRMHEERAAVRRWMAGFGTHPKPPTPTQLKEIAVQGVIPPFRAAADELSELPPPPADAKTVAEILKKIDAGVKVIEERPAEGIQANPITEGAKAAIEYGLTACEV